MNLHRIAVKFFIAPPAQVDLGAIIPVFHQWIQQSKVPGMLIDVADYAHMVNGPGVILIGHDVDYALDMAGGRPGLLHRRKMSVHESCNLNDLLSSTFRSALLACQCLEQETSLAEKIRFRADEVELTIEDRLHAPNSASTFEEIRGDVTKFLESVYAGASIRIEPDKEDKRRCLSLRITTSGAPDVAALTKQGG